MIDKQRLVEKCSTWNIALTGTQLDQLDAFAQILVDYNQKVNLTAITDPEGIEDKHFLDSLLFASQPEVCLLYTSMVNTAVLAPSVAAAWAASMPACPAPITMTS